MSGFFLCAPGTGARLVSPVYLFNLINRINLTSDNRFYFLSVLSKKDAKVKSF